MNTLASLLENYRKRRNITKPQLAYKLNYKNVNKFYKRLEIAINELKDPNDLIIQTIHVLNIPEYLYLAARSEVIEQLNESLKAQFKPSVHIIYQYRMNMTTAWGRSLSVKPFQLSGNESIEEQFTKAANHYKNFSQKYTDVDGYVFNRAHLESYHFNRDGVFLAQQ